jgi:hypothetical protein
MNESVYFWRLAIPFVLFNASFYGLGGIVLPLLAEEAVKAGLVFAALNVGVALGAPLGGRLIRRVRLDVLEFASLAGGLASWSAITWLDPRGLVAYAFLLGLFAACMITVAPCCVTCAYPRQLWDGHIAKMQTWMMGGQVLGLLLAFVAPMPGTGLALQLLALLSALPIYIPPLSATGNTAAWSLHRPCVELSRVAHDWSNGLDLETVWIRRLLPLYGTWFLAALAAAPIYATYPLLMEQLFATPPREASLVFAVASLTAVGTSVALVHLTPRTSCTNVLRGGTGLRLLGLILMLLAMLWNRSLFGALGFIIFVNGWMAVSVGFNTALSERVPSTSQGAALGLATGLMSLAVIGVWARQWAASSEDN